jgi:hypothetical protein
MKRDHQLYAGHRASRAVDRMITSTDSSERARASRWAMAWGYVARWKPALEYRDKQVARAKSGQFKHATARKRHAI